MEFELTKEDAGLLRDFIGEDDCTSPITLSVGPSKGDEGEEYYGLRVHLTEYPDEGCIPLCKSDKLNKPNQYTLGYKAGLEAAVKLCRQYTNGKWYAGEIAALPVPGETK